MLHSIIMIFSFFTLGFGDESMVGAFLFTLGIDVHRPSMGDLFSLGGVMCVLGLCPFRGAMMATCAFASCFLRL